MNKLSIATAIATTMLCATPVFADVIVKQTPPEGTSIRVVRYDDLNLLSPAGVDTLNGRIKVAVKYVCGDADMRVLDEVSDMRSCRRDSTSRAFAARDSIIDTQLAARASGTTLARADAPVLRVLR